jgi:hypothetical protein
MPKLADVIHEELKSMDKKEKEKFAKELEQTLPAYIKAAAEKAKDKSQNGNQKTTNPG